MFCMQEEKRANKRDKRGAEECTWSGGGGGGVAADGRRLTASLAVLRGEAGGGVVAHGRRLPSDGATVSGGRKKKASALPFSSFSSSSSATFPFPFFRLDMAFQNPNASGVSVVFSLTLTVPFPLLLTVPLGMFSQFSFPSFLVCSLLSSLRFLPFSFLFSLFLPFSPLFACWRWGVFIGQKGAGASLLPPYGSAWGAGLAALPQRRVGWAVGVAGRARLPWCIIMRVCGVSGGGRHVACRVH
jgi:hypothetical protein